MAFSQDSTKKLEKEHPYINFLSTDEKSQTHLFTVGVKYQAMVYSPSFSSNGHYVYAGLNLARFFSRKFVVGMSVDLRPLVGFLYRQPSPGFVNDFNNNFNTSFESQQDSATAYLLKKYLSDRQIWGCSFASYGVMFSLFPNRYGGVLLSAKHGIVNYRLSNVYGNKFVNNGEADNLYFGFYYGQCELTFKPYALFKNSYFNFDDESGAGILKAITVSVFYEQMRIRGAKINGVNWDRIVNASFMSKYGVSQRFGLSLGIGIY